MDGRSVTSYSAGSCTHTEHNEDKPWWRVDLVKEEPVSEVYIVNRLDGKINKLSNFEIRVGRLPFVVISPLHSNVQRLPLFNIYGPSYLQNKRTNSSVIKCWSLFELITNSKVMF